MRVGSDVCSENVSWHRMDGISTMGIIAGRLVLAILRRERTRRFCVIDYICSHDVANYH